MGRDVPRCPASGGPGTDVVAALEGIRAVPPDAAGSVHDTRCGPLGLFSPPWRGSPGRNRVGFLASLTAFVVFQRSGDRSRHGQYHRVCPGQGDRRQRTLHRRGQSEDGPGRGRRTRGQGDARQDAREHHGHPADEGRRDRRLRAHREDARVLHPPGPQSPPRRPAPNRHRRAFRDHAGRKAGRAGFGIQGQGHGGISSNRR